MTDEQSHIARAAAALDDPGVTREATAPRDMDPLREAQEDALRKAGQAVLRKWRHMAPIQLADYHGERCDCMPCQMGKLEAALAAAPQPAPVDRGSLESLIEQAEKDARISSDPKAFVWVTADALIADGWRKPGAVQPDETLAWGAVNKDSAIQPDLISKDRVVAEGLAKDYAERAVRVAIRIVEDEA